MSDAQAKKAMVTCTIDNTEVTVPKGTTILKAAMQAGITVPQLCYQEGMHPYGACRVCTVEIFDGRRSRLQASCTSPVLEGLVISTSSPKVLSGRRIILELLLARCGEVKQIREFARTWGVEDTRFDADRPDDCILCGLCVRACRDVVGEECLAFSGRGISRGVDVPFSYHPESCIGCGLCTYVCPTGKMQMESITADTLRSVPGTMKQCRYMLMGIISSKTCPEHITCSTCPYDQLVESELTTHPALMASRAQQKHAVQAGPFTYDLSCRYGANHTWVRSTGDTCMVGIDHFASSILSSVDSADVRDGCIQLESGGRNISLQLPVEGEVIRVNPRLETVPQLVGYAPYHRGWIAIMREAEGHSSLLEDEEARQWFDEETHRLAQMNILKGEKIDQKQLSRSWDELIGQFFAMKQRGTAGKEHAPW